MAESFYTNLEVGGSMSEATAVSVIDIIGNNFDDGTFEVDFKNLTIKVLEGNGNISYEEFQEIEAALRKMNLSFVLTMYPKDDNKGINCYNFPDLNLTGETDCDGNGHPIIRISEIKPLINLMLDIIKEGTNALAIYINDETIKDLVAKTLSSPDNLIINLEKELNQVLPELPKIPKLVITEALT